MAEKEFVKSSSASSGCPMHKEDTTQKGWLVRSALSLRNHIFYAFYRKLLL